jgi:hypothetical protein
MFSLQYITHEYMSEIFFALKNFLYVAKMILTYIGIYIKSQELF